ncbi:hypothetical protein [Halobacillus sp. BBL2006]|uniref:hypothetical protein n=1 Tax=Halobacillus sp. BBL2006 TaxID=1543706 RepID=UPI000A67528E|nr:hypothetical protein [Halobacillus sp. BBL2006]
MITDFEGKSEEYAKAFREGQINALQSLLINKYITVKAFADNLKKIKEGERA